MPVRGNVIWGIVLRGTVRRGNIFGELSFGEKSVGEMTIPFCFHHTDVNRSCLFGFHTELPESNVILSNIIGRSDNSIGRLKISNFNKHLNGSSLHLNRHGKGKLAMNLIKKLRELRRRKFNRN